MKGASKKAKPSRPSQIQRPKKEDVQRIHSDSQRMIRGENNIK